MANVCTCMYMYMCVCVEANVAVLIYVVSGFDLLLCIALIIFSVLV